MKHGTKCLLLFATVLLLAFNVSCGDDDDDSVDGENSTPEDDDDDNDDDDTDSDVFQVGFAKVDITPDVDVIMAGYGSAFFSVENCRWSTGIHDPLFAHAVAFEDSANSSQVILIVLDNVGTITNEIVRIQQQIAQQIQIDPDSVVVAATHTHGGPDTIGLFGVIIPPITGRQEDVVEKMVEGAVEAGVTAWQNRVPATC